MKATKAVVVTLTVQANGAKGTKKFISTLAPDLEPLQRYAKMLGIDAEIVVSQEFDFGDNANDIARGWLDVVAAETTGAIAGAGVDPVRARLNEFEHRFAANERKLDKLIAMMEANGGSPRTKVTAIAQVQRPESAQLVADEAEVEDGGEQAGVPEQVRTEAARKGFPIAQRTPRGGRREVLAEHGNGQMSIVGPSAKSEIFEIDQESGEYVKRPLPKVGDTLRPLQDLSDI